MTNFNRLEYIEPEDLEEHVFELFTSRVPDTSHGLGFIQRANKVNISVGEYDLTVTQSLATLNSTTESSTTGAVVWKVAPYFAEWLLKEDTVFHFLLNQDTTIVELGAGSGGVLPCVLAGKVKTYLVTDQRHIIKLARKNIDENASSKALSKIECFDYDWEQRESSQPFLSKLDGVQSNGVVLATDTIYNEYLIPHFVNAVSGMIAAMGEGSQVILAQQLRDSQIFEDCLRALMDAGFSVWSVPDHHLSPELVDGFAVHYLMKKN